MSAFRTRSHKQPLAGEALHHSPRPTHTHPREWGRRDGFPQVLEDLGRMHQQRQRLHAKHKAPATPTARTWAPEETQPGKLSPRPCHVEQPWPWELTSGHHHVMDQKQWQHSGPQENHLPGRGGSGCQCAPLVLSEDVGVDKGTPEAETCLCRGRCAGSGQGQDTKAFS